MLKRFYKLFYLIGMAIPLIALIPTLFFFAFNERANDYTSSEVIVTTQYQTNEVNSQDDLIIGNIYKIRIYSNANFNALFSLDDEVVSFYFPLSQLSLFNSSDYRSYKVTSSNNLNGGFEFDYFDGDIFPQTTISLNFDNNNDEDFVVDFIYKNIITDFYIYLVLLDKDYIVSNLYLIASASDFLGETTYEVIESDFNPSNAIYYSMDLTSDYLNNGVFKFNGKAVFSGWFNGIMSANFGADMTQSSVSNYLLMYLDFALTFNLIFIAFRSITWLTDMIIHAFNRGFDL